MRVEVEQFMRPCNCRSAGECSHNATAEMDALYALVDAFAAEMKSKLLASALVKGRAGWDDPRWPVAEIKQRLCDHVAKGDPVDVANFAAFLWNRQ